MSKSENTKYIRTIWHRFKSWSHCTTRLNSTQLASVLWSLSWPNRLSWVGSGNVITLKAQLISTRQKVASLTSVVKLWAHWELRLTENWRFLSSWVELNWVGFLLFRVITYRSTQLKSIQLNWPLTLSRVTRCNHGHRVKWKCENRGDLQNNFGSSENDRKFGLLNARIDLIYRIAAILRQEGLASRPPKIRVSLLPVMLDETPKLFFFVVWAQALSTNSVTVKVLMT